MKKFVILMLAALLAACASPVPTEQAAIPPEPTQTPAIVIQTVVVEATQAPTDVPPPTEVPPTAAPIVVTVVVEPTQAPLQAAPTQAPATQASGNALISLDNALGRGVFTNMTMSSSNLTLRCAPRDITFNITASNPAIVDVVFYYRIVDLARLYPSEWKAFGNMKSTGSGNFTLTFSGENVNPSLRLDGSWFEFQFVGLAKNGNVVDRSEKFESLVKYTFDCP